MSQHDRRQRGLPGVVPLPPEPLFSPDQFPYDLPDIEASSRRAKAAGLFDLTERDREALEQERLRREREQAGKS